MGVFRFKQFSISQEHAAMKVGTDSDLLGALAYGGQKILDIGTGTGVLALMMAQRFENATITAVEIDDNAVIDAQCNFQNSPWSDRITLIHKSFQDFLPTIAPESFDAIVCNPPYFDKSLECDDLGRKRARHTSSLPFNTLVNGATSLLTPEGVFSVCIPPEVLSQFDSECIIAGLWQKARYEIHTVPDKSVKRYILVYTRQRTDAPLVEKCCMRNLDRLRSEWYMKLMEDFLLNPSLS